MVKFPVIMKLKKPAVELDCFTALASGCVLGALCGGALVPPWMILLFLPFALLLRKFSAVTFAAGTVIAFIPSTHCRPPPLPLEVTLGSNPTDWPGQVWSLGSMAFCRGGILSASLSPHCAWKVHPFCVGQFFPITELCTLLCRKIPAV